LTFAEIVLKVTKVENSDKIFGLQMEKNLFHNLPPGSQKTHDFQLSFIHTSLKRKIKVIRPLERFFQVLSESFLISSVAFCV